MTAFALELVCLHFSYPQTHTQDRIRHVAGILISCEKHGCLKAISLEDVKQNMVSLIPVYVCIVFRGCVSKIRYNHDFKHSFNRSGLTHRL